MIRITLVAMVLCIASDPAAAASTAVRAACREDAIRLCASVVLNSSKRHACMHAHAAQLSKGCITAIRKSR